MNKHLSEVTNEDCMEGMARYPDKYFDLAIVDPPYGLGNKLTQGGTWNKKWQIKGAEWDKLPNKEYFKELFRVSNNWIIWGGNYFIEYLPNCRCFITWHKPYMDGMHTMSNVELALTSFDLNAKKISLNKDLGNKERIHITQKPVALYKWLLQNYAKQGDKILDTHLGSGSSRIAAYEMGFDFTAFELDKEYFEAQEKRYKAHIAQLKMELV
jgi:site-specific DNA-methyltransferase (adenine-specific)